MTEITDDLFEEGVASASPGKRRSRGKRVTIATEHGDSMTISGENLSLDGVIQILESTLGQARKARAMNLTLPTFVAMLRDQARAYS